MPKASPEESSCGYCTNTRMEVHQARADRDRHRAYLETSRVQVSTLETQLIACREATSVGREQDTIARLQYADATQRRDLDCCYTELSQLRREIERLEAICCKAAISTERPGVRDASPIKPATGWGAFTGGQGSQE